MSTETKQDVTLPWNHVTWVIWLDDESENE